MLFGGVTISKESSRSRRKGAQKKGEKKKILGRKKLSKKKSLFNLESGRFPRLSEGGKRQREGNRSGRRLTLGPKKETLRIVQGKTKSKRKEESNHDNSALGGEER